MVAKRLDSRYLPSRRSRSWIKVKQFRRATVPVICWLPWRDGRAGALAIGRPTGQGGKGNELRFGGIVEIGFTDADRIELGRRLGAIGDHSAPPWRHRGEAVYAIPPVLQVEVQLLDWTDQGQARHLSYKGVR